MKDETTKGRDNEASNCGNVAKIREALEAAGKAAREIQMATEEADTAEVAISIAEICERALLFPPRNCDRFASRDEAVREYLHLAANAMLPTELAEDISRWLFAPATPEKGGR